MLKEQLELAGVLLTSLLSGLANDLVEASSNGDSTVNNISDTDEVVLSEASRGHGGSSHAETTRDESRTVTRDGVLVGSNANELKDSLNTATIDAMGLKISKNKVVIGTTADQAVAQTSLALIITKSLGKGLGVGKDLGLVGVEIGSLRLLQGNSKSGDGVVVGTTLVAGEDGVVDGTLEVVQLILLRLGVGSADTLAEEDQGSARSTETLVAGGGDDISIAERTRQDLGGDHSRNVSHISEHVGVDLVANLADALVVDQTAVGTGASNNDLGSVEYGELLELLIVDEAGLLVEAVGDGLEVLGNCGDLLGGRLVSVGQMATVGEVQTHQAIMGIHESRVDVQVGGGTRES